MCAPQTDESPEGLPSLRSWTARRRRRLRAVGRGRAGLHHVEVGPATSAGTPKRHAPSRVLPRRVVPEPSDAKREDASLTRVAAVGYRPANVPDAPRRALVALAAALCGAVAGAGLRAVSACRPVTEEIPALRSRHDGPCERDSPVAPGSTARDSPGNRW